jgi:hypothetical protein
MYCARFSGMYVELGVAISKIAVARNLRRAVLAVERCEVGRIASASRASYGLDALLDCLAIVCCGAAFLSAEDARSFILAHRSRWCGGTTLWPYQYDPYHSALIDALQCISESPCGQTSAHIVFFEIKFLLHLFHLTINSTSIFSLLKPFRNIRRFFLRNESFFLSRFRFRRFLFLFSEDATSLID